MLKPATSSGSTLVLLLPPPLVTWFWLSTWLITHAKHCARAGSKAGRWPRVSGAAPPLVRPKADGADDGGRFDRTARNAFEMFEGRPCLGWMPLKNGRLGDLVWLTYGQVYAKSLQFGSGLRALVDPVPARVVLSRFLMSNLR